jgi:hypothetical protein
MFGRTERQMEKTSSRPRDSPGGDSRSVPTLRPSILLAGVAQVMTRLDLGVPVAANPECTRVSRLSLRGVLRIRHNRPVPILPPATPAPQVTPDHW